MQTSSRIWHYFFDRVHFWQLRFVMLLMAVYKACVCTVRKENLSLNNTLLLSQLNHVPHWKMQKSIPAVDTYLVCMILLSKLFITLACVQTFVCVCAL